MGEAATWVTTANFEPTQPDERAACEALSKLARHNVVSIPCVKMCALSLVCVEVYDEDFGPQWTAL